jgi:hypothetical protein
MSPSRDPNRLFDNPIAKQGFIQIEAFFKMLELHEI